jgi:hypothetical protein
MGTRVLHDQEQNKSCLYDSVTDTAFGPVMYDTDRQEAHDFLELLDEDPRITPEDELAEAWETWFETRSEVGSRQ